MKRVKIFFGWQVSAYLLCGLVLFASCTKNYKDINTDKNKVTTVGAAELPFLFSKAQSVATINQNNYQVAQNLFADQYAQYFACEATYFGSDRLSIVQGWVSAAFNPVYTDAVPQLQTLFTNYDAATGENAIANIVWVLAFHKVTDYWGPIPYFKAGTPSPTVPYDPQDKIYDDFFKRLAAAVAVLKGLPAGTSAYGTYDLIYGGKIAQWIKFANSLRLRLALRISKVDPARAQTEAEAAVAGGVMAVSPADDALIARSTAGGDGNGLSIMSDWNEFRMSASMASVLKGYQDPRLPVYFLPTFDVTNGTNNYQGLRNGLTVAQLGDPKNDHNMNSHVGQRWSSTGVVAKNGTILGTATSNSTPQNVMCTAESYFLRAEGALLGWNMGGSAKDMYNAGITNSLAQWGITDAPTVTAYVNSINVPIAPGDLLNSPPMTNIPVLFGATPAVQLEQIATQKWLALFPDGEEAWADYRRGHVLKLYPVATSDNPDLPDPNTQWIRRINFLTSEIQNNGDEVTKAIQLLGGPDKITTPLWWDKN
ncbi:SusD/RagB family nutrient-binding outer membrane lipoprotein [Flavitalea flava]